MARWSLGGSHLSWLESVTWVDVSTSRLRLRTAALWHLKMCCNQPYGSFQDEASSKGRPLSLQAAACERYVCFLESLDVGENFVPNMFPSTADGPQRAAVFWLPHDLRIFQAGLCHTWLQPLQNQSRMMDAAHKKGAHRKVRALSKAPLTRGDRSCLGHLSFGPELRMT